MVSVTENLELKDKFLKGLTEMYDDKEREGIHVSDLVYCLRKSYFRKFNKVPQDLKTLFYFLDGEQRHKGFQGLIPNLQNEVSVENFGIIGTMDLFNTYDNGIYSLGEPEVIEIKTTRAKPKGEIPPHYLRQGAYYCLLTGRTKFTLVTQHINHQDIIFYNVEFTKDELEEYYSVMLNAKFLLQEAYEAKSPDNLPLIRDSMRWMCTNCEYYDKCYIDNSGKKKEKIVKKVK